MLDEYLALGGVELGNNARALAYSRCLPCCVGLLKGGACDGIHDATSGFVNAVREWQVQAINLATNPSFESTGATVEADRNFVFNPSGRAGGTGLFLTDATATLGAVVEGKEGITIQKTGSNGVTYDFLGSAATVGAFYAGRVKVAAVTADAVGKTVAFLVHNRESLSTTTIPVTLGAVGEHVTVDLPSGPAATTTGQIRFFHYARASETLPTGARFHVAEREISQVPATGMTVTGDFFDGGASPDPDLTASWTGPVNASPSILTGVRVISAMPGAAPDGALNLASTQWAKSGARSVRISPTGGSTGTRYRLSGYNLSVFQAGKTYTVLATLRMDRPLTGTIGAFTRNIWFQTSTGAGSVSTTPSPNEAGVYEHRLTFTVPESGVTWATVILNNGATVGNGDVWWDDLLVVEGTYLGPYFDGSNLPADADLSIDRVSWAGAEDASQSILERNVVTSASESLEPAYTCDEIQRAPWYDPDNEFSQGLAGFYLLRVSGITDSTATATVTQGIDDGGVIGASRHATRSVRVRSMIIGCGNASAEYGLAWLKSALSDTFCARHGDACGTSDLSFFIDCPPRLDQGDTDYAATTARYRRYLHGVGMTSGPIIAEEYETTSGAYVIVVEYILTAESPFVWGETLPISSTGDVLTAYDDIPFNLMRHPNAEVGDGIPAVTATQYVFNGSVEYGATGWANSVSNIPAGITAGASTDIAAVGPNSYRVRLLATGAVSGGVINAYYDVALGAMPAGSKPSLSLWAAALTFGGTPTLDPTLTAEVEWRNGATVVGTTPLGTIPLNGGNATATGLTIPATSTTARIRVRASNITAAAADDLRLYADAFSLTVP